jgi:hypothetical protein
LVLFRTKPVAIAAWILTVMIVSGWRADRIWAAVTVTPALTVSERYSDNLFFSDTDRRSELTTFVEPTVALVTDTQWLTLSATYIGQGAYHRVADEANGYSHGLAFDLDLPILSRQTKRTEVRVSENMTVTQEFPAFEAGEGEQNVEGNEGIQIPRSKTFRNRAGIEVLHAMSQTVRTSIRYDHLLTRYEGGLQDAVVHSAGVGASYQHSLRVGYSVSFGIAVQEFEGVDRVTHGTGSAGLSYRVSQTASVDSQVGIAKIADGTTYTTISLGAQKSLTRVGANVRYIRGIGSGGGLAASSTLSDLVAATASWTVSKDVSASAALAYGHNISIPDRGQLDIVTYEGATGVSMSLKPWLRAGLRYSYLAQEARALAGSDGEKNVVMLTVTATGPSWRLAK